MERKICPVIYKITNSINNKLYVGKDLYNNPNYLGSGKILKLAFKKYGKENFKKKIIENCNDIDHMNIQEKFWIKELNTFSPNGYNINVGGNGGNTYEYRTNEEKKLFKQKMRLVNLGRKTSEETKEIMRKTRRGKPQKRRENIECPYCHKIGDKLNLSKWHFNFCKENPNKILKEIKKIECPYCHKILNKCNAYQWHFDFCKENPNHIIKKGHPNSKETRIKIGNSNRGKKHTEETKTKIRNSSIGKKRSEETKNKHRVNMTKRWENIHLYISNIF
jgi:group I intron endonuclease